MATYAIGCLHLGHENVAIMRGFSSSEEHDDLLISTWNKNVRGKDKVFILGDVTMEKIDKYPLLDKLHGYKHVILGNHDQGQHVPELLKHVQKVSGPFKYRVKKPGQRSITYWMTHIPVHPIEFDYRIDFNVHAHIHELELNDPRYIKVDAHHLNFKPFKLTL